MQDIVGDVLEGVDGEVLLGAELLVSPGLVVLTGEEELRELGNIVLMIMELENLEEISGEIDYLLGLQEQGPDFLELDIVDEGA